jgi:alkylresorcinol/alkylpyrone synthase
MFMPRILSAASALPPHAVPQQAVCDAALRLFGRLPELDSLRRVFENARIDKRQFMRPLDWYLHPRSFFERNTIYLEEGLALAASAARRSLRRAALSPERIDHVIFVSSTGFATPSLDALLINTLGLSPRTSRLPIWGLGCAAGAAGLSRAFDYCRANPESVVLLVALECCSLTLVAEDLSKKNVIGAAIFADGAAAAIVAGEGAGGAGPRLAATRSHLFPGSRRIMGWDFTEEGMQLVLSPRLPALVKEELGPLVAEFLAERGLARGDLIHFLSHPGGAKVLDAYAMALGLAKKELRLSEETLRRHGNVSSVSVLMVLEEWLASKEAGTPGFGLISAFGPGFSAELLLFEVL